MQRVLVTGGMGFVGKAFVARALLNGQVVRVSSRQKNLEPDGPFEYCQIGDLGPETDLSSALLGVEVVVHCAGRAHVMSESEVDPLTAFRAVNFYGTLNLARQAVNAGVKRFLFISTIGVNGSHTRIGKPFSEENLPQPQNAYALSKWEAELGLMRISAETGLEVVIIRPPLVYGYNAPGNFGELMRAVERGKILPLGAIENQRSLVALDNLVDLIFTCSHHPNAANQTFLVSDGEDISTTELLKYISSALGLNARLIPIPRAIILVGAWLVGKSDIAQRLCGNLQVDISKARKLLGWVPVISVKEGLRRAVSDATQCKVGLQ
jgi:nucleoside-diphosphate-sugar epimerase